MCVQVSDLGWLTAGGNHRSFGWVDPMQALGPHYEYNMTHNIRPHRICMLCAVRAPPARKPAAHVYYQHARSIIIKADRERPI